MAVPHAESGKIIEIGPYGKTLREHRTQVLVKAGDLEVIRLVLPEGKEIDTHSAPGRITVQCLEGRVAFTALRGTFDLEAGQMVYLEPGEPHALLAHDDSSLLVTMILPPS